MGMGKASFIFACLFVFSPYVAVNVAPVDGVGAHVGVEIPDADRIVTRAGHERASGQNALHAFFGRGVRFDAPNAGSVVQKRMRFANLP